MSRKDPNKPRGRTTAYAYFVIAEKEAFYRDNPETKLNFPDFSRLCGQKWQTMNEQDREQYETKANEDKARYDYEMANYTPAEGYARNTKSKKRKKDPNAPKRPQTAFFVFSAKFRDEVKRELGEGSRVGDVAKELGRRWKLMSEDDKKEYSEEAARQKIEYEKAMEEYRAQEVKKPRVEPEEYEYENDY